MMRWLALVCAASVYGMAGSFVFRRLTDWNGVRVSVDKMLAHALELPLYFDEPRTVWRAQGALAMENLRLLRRIALPAAAMAVVFFLAYKPADKYLGRRPLEAGQTAVIGGAAPRLPQGLIIDSPPVRIRRTGETFWRVKAAAPDADRFPYNGARTSWILPFAIVSAIVSTLAGISFRR